MVAACGDMAKDLEGNKSVVEGQAIEVVIACVASPLVGGFRQLWPKGLIAQALLLGVSSPFPGAGHRENLSGFATIGGGIKSKRRKANNPSAHGNSSQKT
jgi:hypothetical protein